MGKITHSNGKSLTASFRLSATVCLGGEDFILNCRLIAQDSRQIESLTSSQYLGTGDYVPKVKVTDVVADDKVRVEYLHERSPLCEECSLIFIAKNLCTNNGCTSTKVEDNFAERLRLTLNSDIVSDLNDLVINRIRVRKADASRTTFNI